MINQTGCEFIAIGEVPNIWDFGSTIDSTGNFVVQVLENNLGFDIDWYNDFVPGVYFGMNATTGPIYNSFPRSKVSVMVSQGANAYVGPSEFTLYGAPASIGSKDDVVIVVPFDYNGLSNLEDVLYYTPVEISFKQSLDTTPILATGSVGSSYPFGNVAVGLYADSRFIESFNVDDTSVVNNLNQLISRLNSDINTNYLGIFGYNANEEIQLTINTNLKEQFSPDNVLTFVVYND